MRPEILFPLFASVTSLKGVGDAIAAKLARLGVSRIIDLAFLRPHGVVDRTNQPDIFVAEVGKVASFEVEIVQHQAPRRDNLPHVISCRNASGFLELLFFHMRGNYLSEKFLLGKKYIVSGRVEANDERRQIIHPDYLLPIEQREKVLRVEAQYPLTAGVSQAKMQDIMAQALARIPTLPEWQTQPELGFAQTLYALHHPQSEADLGENSPAILRIAYDELLAHQLLLAKNMQKIKEQSCFKIASGSELEQQVLQKLPFQLTAAQQQALCEISADMQSGQKMLRLLQGDVGSGKTIVALLAMLNVVAAGHQCCFMMPTTLLATQQKTALEHFCHGFGVKIELLTSAIKGKKRDEVFADLASGKTQILIGTHAVFQDAVPFASLGMAIIDEQHRFGVEQRLRLSEKSPQAHILLMSATPIPRTLCMAFYGDMEVSRITQKPANRKKIKTVALPLLRIAELYSSISRALENGEKIYWICPLVEESEKLDLSNVTARFAELNKNFSGKVGLVHGRMKEAEKDQVLQSFLQSETKILVATTVIEVGIDVPDATIIIIENADKFGLSQLHQLRGRVGRGDKQSSCILLYDKTPTKTAQARLKILKDSEDGFEIAEQDLNLRGSGDVLGTRQSGELALRFASLPEHTNLLVAARNEALKIVREDTEFLSARGKNLQLLLAIFEDAFSEKFASG